MHPYLRHAFGTWALCGSLGFASTPTVAGTAPLDSVEQRFDAAGNEVRVRLPAGLELELLTDALDGPRLLSFAPNGDLFVGSQSGKVYRLSPPYTTPQIMVELDDYPHSVALRTGEILIAQTDGLYRAPYQPGQARIERKTVTRLAALPGGGGHSSRSVAIGPDGRVYASLGIGGNCSDEYLDDSYPFTARRGGVLVLDESVTPPRWTNVWNTMPSSRCTVPGARGRVEACSAIRHRGGRRSWWRCVSPMAGRSASTIC